ncbi:MAG: hypothetical protein ACRDH2_05400 [Anaerolineales bacterium]
MPNSNLTRWAGLAYLLAGVSLIIQQLYALAAPDPTTGGWVAVHTLGYFGLALGLLGLPGIYAAQKEQVRRLGLVGFLLAFIGNALTGGPAFLNTYLVPVLTRQAPEVLAPTGPLFTGPAGLVILLSAVLVTLGFILFGISILRAGTLPRGAALLVILSSWFGLATAFSPLVFAIAGAVFGLASAWLGYAVWSGKRQMSPQANPAM